MGKPIAPQDDSGDPRGRLPRRVVAAVAVGTPLTPLNSTMIAVALVQIQSSFQVSLADVSWLISSFYLAASVGQPVMGRIVDRFGPRRIYCWGLVLVGLSGALSPLAPSLGWLVVCRILLALGTSSAYPAGMAIYRRESGSRSHLPVAAMAITSIAASVTAALGPALGGFLLTVAGWPSIFVVNVPVASFGVAMALRWIPADAVSGSRRTLRAALAVVDLPGVVLFAASLTTTLALLLSATSHTQWWLAPAAALGWCAFVRRELTGNEPFMDLRMLRANRPLVDVLSQFLVVNVAFYSIYFGLPVWLERSRGFAPHEVGLLVLPTAAVGIVFTPVTAYLLARFGPRRIIMLGSVLLACGSLLLMSLDGQSSVPHVLLAGFVLGFPNSFNNFGLQAALYLAAPLGETGMAAGLYQSSRYIGAIISSCVLALLSNGEDSGTGFHSVAVFALALSALLVVLSLRFRRTALGA